jgi:hypothetical protein
MIWLALSSVIIASLVFAYKRDPVRLEEARVERYYAERRRVLERRRDLYLRSGTDPVRVGNVVSEVDKALEELAKEQRDA